MDIGFGMHLTVFTDYGLRSLMYVGAHPDRLCSVKEISEYYGISRNHLVKVVHRLSQLGYISSTKGNGGGIKLAQEPEKLKLGEIVTKLEPKTGIIECIDKNTKARRIMGTCQLKHYLGEANTSFIDTLNKHTLADCIKDKNLFQV